MLDLGPRGAIHRFMDGVVHRTEAFTKPQVAAVKSLGVLERPLRVERGAAVYRRRRILTRPGSMTEKWPFQSSRAATRAARRCPAASELGAGTRKSTTPQPRGNADRAANSPKS